MIDQLPPSMGPVPIRPKPSVPRQPGASFQEWLVDPTPPGGDGNGTPDGGTATGATGAAGAIGDSAGPTLRRPTLRIELLVRDAHGNAELVAVPWQLAAGGHLAQESISASQLVGGDVVHAPCGVPEPTVRAGGTQSIAPAAATPPVSYAEAAATTAAFFSPARASVAAAPETDANTRTATSTAAAIPLAIRLMRWMEQHGHDPHLWIRDYRLDEAGARVIADAMRQLARDQGLQLERIMVNAREVWRASTPGKENLACP